MYHNYTKSLYVETFLFQLAFTQEGIKFKILLVIHFNIEKRLLEQWFEMNFKDSQDPRKQEHSLSKHLHFIVFHPRTVCQRNLKFVEKRLRNIL